MNDTIRIVLADDHTIVRDGIKYLLEEEDNISIVGEASNGQEALELVAQTKPDILIIDIRMPVMNGIEAVKALNSKPTNTKAIVLSMHDSEEYILNSINAKAMGYLLKDSGKDEILKAIDKVFHNEKYFSGAISNVIINNLLEKKQQPEIQPTYKSKQETPFNLTKKEFQILKLILSGKTNKEISEELQNSTRTIETHRFKLMKKMNVKNSIELSAKASEFGLI